MLSRFLRPALLPLAVCFILSVPRVAHAAGVAPADFREIVNNARRTAFPSVVYLHCIIENFERGERLCVSASGSGVIISADGEVVTNWHVVNKAVEVRALLNDGRAFPVEIIGADKDSDLALVRLKLPPGETVSALKIATDDTLQEGDFVMALGAPWGLNRTVTFGIISCARRYLPSNSEYSTWIQTDTSISPGNSGGPLVDLNGKIVGINARGMLFGGDTGFAVPASMVRLLVSRLRVGGTNGANWTWTGLQLQPLRDFQRNIYFEGDRGAIVTGTDENSPAREAGIRSQDRLIRINGAGITARMEEDLPQIRRMLATLPTDTPAQLTVLRDGNEVELSIHPRAKGSVQGEELTCPRWDFTVKEINKFEVPDLSYQRASGVYISGIRHPGNAAASGLAVRDIVVSINGIEVRGIDEIRAIHEKSVAALKTGTGARRIVIMVMRGGQLLQVVIDISKDYAVK
ncbi:serine protease Do [Ereboglobus sp. PH5-5]|uniref:trypsin-like peptidase domain-containing protein n=1 Tax=Ereboglobus sp. PH5-5 TaxID=2940529 RepID=UPI0024069966|nr:trypsin-like peptidase domain-containing protein [Ereboglobus sp. PH5-5]MDF9831922.1 serine protease Do [Ereboglobus sp. PH5-5]